ncbi:MAG TPA: hypothetical protein VIT21_10670 [Chthoniobacterales bacterium]
MKALTRNTLAVTAALAVLATPLLAEDHKHGMMEGRHGQMSKMHSMMDDWKTQDAELEKLATEMKTAEGDKKIAAIAAVASKLVELRLADHAKMASMPGMMADCCAMMKQTETEAAKKTPEKADAGQSEQ